MLMFHICYRYLSTASFRIIRRTVSHRVTGDSPNLLFDFNKMVVVAGFGNPLFDVTVKITNDELLKKYNLTEDGQKELPKNDMKQLFDDISKYEKYYSAGGCVQNTLRILQWLLKAEGTTFMFGCIGNDDKGKILKELVKKDGVNTRYVVHDSQPTGSSIALTNGSNRTLVANIGAAEYLTIEIFLQNSENLLALQKADVVYMEGFFLTNRIDVARYILEFCKKNHKLFVFNISGVYMCEERPEDMKYFAEQCDILFGNKREYQALSKVMKHKNNNDVESFAVDLIKSYIPDAHISLKYGKMAIITNGAESVLCVHSGGIIDKTFVLPLDKEDIKDTTGAGDTFVSGFLAGLFENRTPLTCLKWGSWVSQQIIKQVGCTVPPYSSKPIQDIE